MNPYYNPQTQGQTFQPYTGGGQQPVYGGQGQTAGSMPMMPQGGGMAGMGGMPQGGGMAGMGGMNGMVANVKSPMATGPQVPGMLPIEQSYIENILRLNKGKLVTVHATFENNREWNAKIFKGIIEAAGRDHLILSDPQTGQRYLIPMVNVDYVTFDEEIEYEYPFGGGPALGTYPPR